MTWSFSRGLILQSSSSAFSVSLLVYTISQLTEVLRRELRPIHWNICKIYHQPIFYLANIRLFIPANLWSTTHLLNILLIIVGSFSWYFLTILIFPISSLSCTLLANLSRSPILLNDLMSLFSISLLSVIKTIWSKTR